MRLPGKVQLQLGRKKQIPAGGRFANYGRTTAVTLNATAGEP